MYSRKQILDFTFQEAINHYHFKSIKKEIEEQVLEAGMRTYAKREGFEFTDEEIHSTIVAGIETLNKSGEDFTLKLKKRA